MPLIPNDPRHHRSMKVSFLSGIPAIVLLAAPVFGIDPGDHVRPVQTTAGEPECGHVLSWAQDEFFIQMASRRYHPETWPEQPSVSGVATNWFPSFPDWLVESSSIVTNVENNTNFTSFRFNGRDRNRRENLRLRLSQREDFSAARNGLLETLGGMESTISLPSGTNGLECLGDICYASLAQPSFVLFVRNNVFVSCYARLDENSLTNLLFSLDQQVLESLSPTNP